MQYPLVPDPGPRTVTWLVTRALLPAHEGSVQPEPSSCCSSSCRRRPGRCPDTRWRSRTRTVRPNPPNSRGAHPVVRVMPGGLVARDRTGQVEEDPVQPRFPRTGRCRRSRPAPVTRGPRWHRTHRRPRCPPRTSVGGLHRDGSDGADARTTPGSRSAWRTPTPSDRRCSYPPCRAAEPAFTQSAGICTWLPVKGSVRYRSGDAWRRRVAPPNRPRARPGRRPSPADHESPSDRSTMVRHPVSHQPIPSSPTSDRLIRPLEQQALRHGAVETPCKSLESTESRRSGRLPLGTPSSRGSDRIRGNRRRRPPNRTRCGGES